MICGIWKIKRVKYDIYYYRKWSDGNLACRVYPLFGLNIFSGPTNIIQWNIDFGDSVHKKNDLFSALAFADIKLSEVLNIKLIKPMFPSEMLDEQEILEDIRNEYTEERDAYLKSKGVSSF